MFLSVVIICLFQYTTYEDCVKEAYMAAAKCRVSRLPLLTFNIYQSVKIFTVAMGASVQDPTLLGAHVRQVRGSFLS